MEGQPVTFLNAVADTGFVVALLNCIDVQHEPVKAIYEQTSQPILLPQTTLAEVAYLVGQASGIATVAAFLQGLSASRFQLEALIEQDVQRVAQILKQYADSRIDFVDASVMAVAERHRITTIMTLDHRDFRLFRPSHCPYFELLP
jgi:uncharacterized protein